MIKVPDEFVALSRHLNRRPSGRKMIIPLDCPECGKPAVGDRGKIRSSFGLVFAGGTEWGFHCFVCGHNAFLDELCDLLGVDHSGERRRPYADHEFEFSVPPATEPAWKSNIENYFQLYRHHPDRYQLWAEYKGLTAEEVDLYQLGVGRLPETKPKRLITPLFDLNGRVQGFRGREPSGGGWYSAAGLTISEVDLQHVGRVKKGDYVFIVENWVDAALVNARTPYAAVASMSTSYWQDHWTDQLQQARPRVVIVAYDADLAGNGVADEDILRQLVTERLSQVEHGEVRLIDYKFTKYNIRTRYRVGGEKKERRLPLPAGMRLRQTLRSSGLVAYTARWSADHVGKDIGDFIGQGDNLQ